MEPKGVTKDNFPPTKKIENLVTREFEEKRNPWPYKMQWLFHIRGRHNDILIQLSNNKRSMVNNDKPS